MALADYKKYLREEKISGRCEIVGSGRNGSGWVSQGNNLSLYFGYDESEALSACRRVTALCVRRVARGNAQQRAFVETVHVSSFNAPRSVCTARKR